MRYYLGLDNGGTNTKAALFTPDGTQIAVESVATAALTPAPGFVERDMEEMWRDNCAVIRGVIEKSGVRAEEIAGVGLCGHGKGLYLWGKDAYTSKGRMCTPPYATGDSVVIAPRAAASSRRTTARGDTRSSGARTARRNGRSPSPVSTLWHASR